MQTVRTFRKLRGGRQGRAGQSTSYETHRCPEAGRCRPGCWEEAVGRVNLQSQNEVWGAAPGRETGKSKVVAPLRVHLGKRKNAKACAASPARATGLPRGWASSYLTLQPVSAPGAPLPIRQQLGSLERIWARAAGGSGAGGSLPGPWLDGGLDRGCPTGAE